MGRVRHHDWLNIVHNMTQLAQFNQQVHTVLLGLRMFGDLTFCIYCPRLKYLKAEKLD